MGERDQLRTLHTSSSSYGGTEGQNITPRIAKLMSMRRTWLATQFLPRVCDHVGGAPN